MSKILIDFKEDVIQTLRDQYSVTDATVSCLNYGNVFKNIKGVQVILDDVEKYNQYNFETVTAVCDLILNS
jgi:hypothetical protein